LDKNKTRESKRFIVGGLISLVAGSFLLFVFILPDLPEFWGTLSSLAGGGLLLCGNGCIVYGLLISVGHQETE